VNRNFSATVLITLAATLMPLQTGEAAETRPRLILQVTVDQLRGDMPAVVLDRLAPGGIGYAIPSTDLVTGRVPDAAPIARQVLRNFSPKRSGDIYIIYEPHWSVTGTGDVAIVSHGSPWRYDTFVPIVFAGNGLPAQRISRPVETVDIAATLAAYLGIKPPSGSVGKPLLEVLPE